MLLASEKTGRSAGWGIGEAKRLSKSVPTASAGSLGTQPEGFGTGVLVSGNSRMGGTRSITG